LVARESGQFGPDVAPFSWLVIPKAINSDLQRHRRQALENSEDFSASTPGFMIGVHKSSAVNRC